MSQKLYDKLVIWAFVLVTAVVAALIYSMLSPARIVLGC